MINAAIQEGTRIPPSSLYEFGSQTGVPHIIDATNRFVTFDEAAALQPTFEHDGEPIELSCEGLEAGFDSYNPTPLVRLRARRGDTNLTDVIGMRTESHEQPFVAETRFCHYRPDGRCVEIEGVPRKPWEDPHMVVLPDGRIVAYGVHVDWDEQNPSVVSRFATEFYIGTSLDDLQFLGRSPYGHKDSRLEVRKDGSLCLFIRPQKRPRQGAIACVELACIEELAGDGTSPEATNVYERAHLLGLGVFGEGTWGGPNDVHDLGNGWDMIVGHIAKVLPNPDGSVWDAASGTEPHMVYSGIILFYNRQTRQVIVTAPHAHAKDFLYPDKYKRLTLQQVMFSAGVVLDPAAAEGFLEGMAWYGKGDASVLQQHLRSIYPIESHLKAIGAAATGLVA